MTTALLVTARIVDPARPDAARAAGAMLRDIHRQWMNETWQWLAPALSPNADFWNGWSAVRYIGDHFHRQYRRQRDLVAAILPFLRPADAVQLRVATEALERTRRYLDRIGRRQGVTELVAALSGQFLDLLGAWFAEIQRVTQEFTRSELPPPAQRALRQLEAAVAIRGDHVRPHYLSKVTS
jgi:integrase